VLELLHVLLFPYLPINRRAHVGSWELIPFRLFDARDARDARADKQARQLFDLYELPRGAGGPLGALVRRARGKVGDRVRPSSLPPLRRAVLAALLDANPADRDFGHGVATADNAVLYGHRISRDGSLAATYGELVTTLIGGLRLGTDHSAIHPPIELPTPMLARDLDERFAEASLRVIGQDSDEARRVSAALDCLDLAWRNSTSTTQQMRIPALYSGFEVLLGVGNGRLRMARALSSRLGRDSARKREHVWRQRPESSPRRDLFSDLEWWFMRFGELRNAIAHGDELRLGLWRHGRRWHFWIGEERLRQAITDVVAERTGLPELRYDRGERVFAWMARDALPHFQKLALECTTSSPAGSN
jgi:hypothetical protein